MRDRVFQAVLFGSAVTLAVAAGPTSSPPPLTVHEWGTFTSIAGADGHAVVWLPLEQQSDLPCFVERKQINLKGSLAGTVRMETPVLYLYAPRALDASVHVAFPHGLMTEWYPHADVTSNIPNFADSSGTIDWPRVSVQPGASEAFPVESGASHYYAARHTAAAPVRVGAQTDRFLFYRGVGQFQPPLSAVARQDGGVAVRNPRGSPLGDIILFENRRGAMTFTAQRFASAEAVLPRPALDDASGAPLAELKRILMAHGLFEPEAQAMIETWKDSWFEEGARLIYIVPRVDVDQILPLTMSPKPSSLARVFVGRIELLTPATLHDVSAAVVSGDRALLAKYGRFLAPIAERAGLTGKIPATLLPPAPAASCR